MPSSQPVSLRDVRQLKRLARGEPAAFDELWAAWKDPVWSVLQAMAGSSGAAIPLLKQVYRTLPAASRRWDRQLGVGVQLAAVVHGVVCRDLELPELDGIQAPLPRRVLPPTGAEIAARISRIPPNVRLIYLLDLFLPGPAATLAALTGESEARIRAARSFAAWALVDAEGQP